jgi:hypothetical protein
MVVPSHRHSKNGPVKLADESTNWLFTYELNDCIQRIFFDYYMPMGVYNLTFKKLQNDVLNYYKNIYAKEDQSKIGNEKSVNESIQSILQIYAC